MSTWSQTALLDVDLRPGRPPVLPVADTGEAGDVFRSLAGALDALPVVVVGMADPRRLTDWSPDVEVSGR